MLVLSRRPLERIRIGENIIVTVVGIQPGRVRLGIEAPGQRIIREEVDIVWNLTDNAAANQELVTS